MGAYYIPRTKRELVSFLVARLTCTKSSLTAMPIKQLYAIYHRVRRSL
jgi:hypothetical protein